MEDLAAKQTFLVYDTSTNEQNWFKNIFTQLVPQFFFFLALAKIFLFRKTSEFSSAQLTVHCHCRYNVLLDYCIVLHKLTVLGILHNLSFFKGETDTCSAVSQHPRVCFCWLITAHLATSGLCLTASRRGSVLMRMAQQGKQASSRIRTPLWRITPTRFKLPLPYVCVKQVDRRSGEKSWKTQNPTKERGYD